jgi:hypothetical protein
MTTLEKIRNRCEFLHEAFADTMEPEDVYEQVAREFGMKVEELYEVLVSDCQ